MTLRIVTFGDLEQDLWGAAWTLDADGLLTAGGLDQEHAPQRASLSDGDAEKSWSLSAGETRLQIGPLSAAAPASALEQADSAEAFDQLCRVTGTLAVHEGRRELDCMGRRAARAAPDPHELESLRDFSAWFEPESGVALSASRPRGATGHESDVLRAVLFEPASVQEVAEPRLSTTYDSEQLPISLSLELWLEQEGEQEQLYPRRAAGRALSAGVSATLDGFALQAIPFRCTTAGLEGAGVYLLARGA